MQDIPAFIAFLIRAKRATYAGGAAPTGASRPASIDLQYVEADFLYLDTYLGNRNFLGEEAVWLHGQPIWGMNYHGIMRVEIIPDGFSKILHAALSAVPVEAPYRGPAELTMGDFRYFCTWQGTIGQFNGSERIEHLAQPIYELVFHGGKINS
jgi:hypothetical protein